MFIEIKMCLSPDIMTGNNRCTKWLKYLHILFREMIASGPCDMYKQNECTEKQWRKLLIYIAIFGRFHLSSMTTKQCLCIVVFRSQLWFISYYAKCTLYKLKPNIIRDIFINHLMLICWTINVVWYAVCYCYLFN